MTTLLIMQNGERFQIVRVYPDRAVAEEDTKRRRVTRLHGIAGAIRAQQARGLPGDKVPPTLFHLLDVGEPFAVADMAAALALPAEATEAMEAHAGAAMDVKHVEPPPPPDPTVEVHRPRPETK